MKDTIPVPREVLQQAIDVIKRLEPYVGYRGVKAEHARKLVLKNLQALLTAPAVEPCIGKDPLCPCQDGDACHYKDCGDTKAWPVPAVEPQVQEPKKGENELSFLIDALDKHCGSGFIPHGIENAFAAYQIATKGTL